MSRRLMAPSTTFGYPSNGDWTHVAFLQCLVAFWRVYETWKGHPGAVERKEYLKGRMELLHYLVSMADVKFGRGLDIVPALIPIESNSFSKADSTAGRANQHRPEPIVFMASLFASISVGVPVLLITW